jgi:cholesterol transport system auxiliary component
MTISRRVLFAGVPALVVAGCADVVGPLPAPKLYTLAPPLPGPGAGAKVGWALTLQMPDANAGLDSARIALTRPPSGLDYYADAAWSDRLPVLAEAALLEAFERSGRIASVAPESVGARTDYYLAVDIRDFACRYDAGEGAPLAVVRLAVRVVDARSRKIVGTAVFAREVRAGANSVAAAVAALTEAYGGALSELVPWVLDRGGPV